MIISASLLRSLREVGQWARRSRYRLKVVGSSMEPTLLGGEYVLVDPAAIPSVGDVAVASHPNQRDLLVVKRVAELTVDGAYVLLGDNPAGSDSRDWGPVAAEEIRGVVTLVLDRPMAPFAPSEPVDDRRQTGPRRRLVRLLRR